MAHSLRKRTLVVRVCASAALTAHRRAPREPPGPPEYKEGETLTRAAWPTRRNRRRSAIAGARVTSEYNRALKEC
uniref:Uncharacterized protein n=1 Tax=Ixodes ricinus TaxID=34613 RepID=A0A6B0UAX6_IXORI